MSRLYDRIMRDKNFTKSHPELVTVLQNSQVISADNVAHYLGQNMNDGEAWKDYPCCIPIFPNLWIEYRLPRGQNIPERAGLYLFSSHEKKDFVEFANYFCSVTNFPSDVLDADNWISDDVHWLSSAVAIYDWGNLGIRAEYAGLFRFGEDGRFIRGGLFPGVFLEEGLTKRNASIINEYARQQGYNPQGLALSATVYRLLNVPFMALAFMHCKNVELIDEVPPLKLSAKHEKKYGVPMVKYKTLKVHSMRREYAEDERESQPGIPKSLHICRGHFKDYRNGGGLFGKYEGIYWWDSHVRGDANRGVVVKDYDVQAPRE